MKNTILRLILIFPVWTFCLSNANDLEVLTDAYEREKARVLAPVELKYDRALKELLLKFTQAGRLDEANAVQALIEDRNNGAGGDFG